MVSSTIPLCGLKTYYSAKEKEKKTTTISEGEITRQQEIPVYNRKSIDLLFSISIALKIRHPNKISSHETSSDDKKNCRLKK